jgi:hypothetical protein
MHLRRVCTVRRLLWLAFAICGLLGEACAHKIVEVSCGLGDAPSAVVPVPVAMDLTGARAFYDYVAVTKVEPAGEHFTVWYVDVEPVFERLLVKRKPQGGLAIESEGAVFGGIGGPPPAEALAPEVADMARELEARLRKRCPQGREWHVRYAGNNRTVTVQEFVAHDPGRRVTSRAGWVLTLTVAMDERLSKIEHTIEQTSGFGIIEIPEGALWIEVDQGGPERLRLAKGPNPEMEEKIAAAARRLAEGQGGPSLGSLVPADAPMLPVGFVSRVVAKLAVRGGAPSEVRIPLDVREAVFGSGASGDSEFRTRERRYSVQVRLMPKSPLATFAERRSSPYTGTLKVRIADDLGHTWERSYPSDGVLETEGDSAVMPAGLELPGASAPSPEEQALHIKLDGPDEARVDVSLFDDPRRP